MSDTRAERLHPLVAVASTEENGLVPTRAAILPRLESPADIRSLTIEEMKQLAGEVRERIIRVIARKGGHFGAPLGAVDIAIALLHTMELPRDRVVWDVGHQAYAWKILTGRNDQFETIRQKDGLSGFLKRKESEYDSFGAGHASTSIAAALGMALARDVQRKDYRVTAVIGDGAMTGGMAYEALNNAGLRKTRMMVILNDNEMSISENVWVVHDMFRKAVTHPLYARARQGIVPLIKRISPDGLIDFAHRMEETIKGMIVPGLFFEELGFRYIGPIDGHDIGKLVETLESVRDLPEPICLHIITQKGKGYKFAENDPIKYHAAANMKVETGEMAAKSGPPAYTTVFGETLVKIARRDPKVVGITAAMDSGTGLDILAKALPRQFFDVGIAEECAVTMAAGMAADGLKPVCAIYSTFLQRAIDQIIHDVALQDLPVFFVLDRAGLVGADGPTHHGTFDLTYLRMIPNMVVMAPKDEVELRDMTLTGLRHTGGPIAMRYPRGAGIGLPLNRKLAAIPIGKGEVVREGVRIALVGIGKMVAILEKTADILGAALGHRVTVINARFVKPLDEELLLATASTHEHLFTAEDNTVVGGFGSAVNEMLLERGAPRHATVFGLPDDFVDHGTQEQLFEQLGLGAEQLAERILASVGAASLARHPVTTAR
jgi:1-deoxy-D-xylulose-5-phosphate synthase